MPVTFLDHFTDNVDTSALSERVPTTPYHDENGEPSAATNESKSNWKSTAFATVKLLLRGVRDSADAFPPLKSVAGGLCFIVENYEVRPLSCLHCLALTGALANEGECTGDRVIGSPSQSALRIALRICFRG